MSAAESAPVPNPAADLLQRIDSLAQEIRTIQQQLAEQLRAQPDNPDVRRIGPCCFSMPFRCLDQQLTLDPFRYDWQAQFDRLAGHIGAMMAHPARAAGVFKAVLAAQAETAHGRQYRYAPEVVAAACPVLKSALALLHGLGRLQTTETLPPDQQ